MAFETREQVLQKVMEQEKPKCPHCNHEMSIWEVPEINFSDGLGWGVPFLFVCFNDECSLYKSGWENIQENYAHNASYRCINYPGSDNFELMPVFSPIGATGQIIDDQVILEREAIKEATKQGFSILADCYVKKDWYEVMRLLMDSTQPPKVRIKAAEMLGDIGDLEVIDPMKSYKFGNEILQQMVDDSVAKIHERFFTKECPHCAEIIKKRANICKHCGKDLTV